MPHQSILSRRSLLKFISSASIASIALNSYSFAKSSASKNDVDATQNDTPEIAFYAQHQAGIITPPQKHLYLLSLDLLSIDKKEIIELFKAWTKLADLKTHGGRMQDSANEMLAPNDTGDADDLDYSNLTVTFGFGASFFSKNGVDRYGIKHKAAQYLRKIPVMPNDKLNDALCDGDLCIQICAPDQQIAFHMVRNFIRIAARVATPKWLEHGFLTSPYTKTARNLFGFKDGTANNEHAMLSDEVIWAGANEPAWMQGGSYLGYRKIPMFLEIWDRVSMLDQEDTFGRKKESGASYGQEHEFDETKPEAMPDTAHIRLVRQTKQHIHRRAYSYSAGINARTGAIDAGLLFICFTRNPDQQFLPMLKVLGLKDQLNEYSVHIGSALFACPKGLREGEYLGQSLLEDLT